MKYYLIWSAAVALSKSSSIAFSPPIATKRSSPLSPSDNYKLMKNPQIKSRTMLNQFMVVAKGSKTELKATSPDLDVISLVVGQENYGLAIVSLGEGIWSFVSGSPTVSYAIRTILPSALAAIVLLAVSGPMMTGVDADLSSIGNGLWIATLVSIALAINYVLRLLAPYSESPKEIAALGLLVAIAGFFSFSQNLIVDGFVSLPSLPTIELPSLF